MLFSHEVKVQERIERLCGPCQNPCILHGSVLLLEASLNIQDTSRRLTFWNIVDNSRTF